MKKPWFLVCIALCVVVAGYLFVTRQETPVETPVENESTLPITPVTEENAVPKKDDLIIVTNISNFDQIESPLTIRGEARGTWYFEASFPVQIEDAEGNVIASIPAQAQGDWMTENYVPFEATLTFVKPATATGTIVLRKDNPSGLPQYENELRIPVRF